MKAYEYRHVVGFEETSLAGNVYYANHLRWQGRARELFLRQYAPDILSRLEQGFALVTLSCSCDYLAELRAFDEVCVCMFLVAMTQNRITMRFEYWRENQPRELVARGKQEIACMQREGNNLGPAPVPKSLREALAPFAQTSFQAVMDPSQ